MPGPGAVIGASVATSELGTALLADEILRSSMAGADIQRPAIKVTKISFFQPAMTGMFSNFLIIKIFSDKIAGQINCRLRRVVEGAARDSVKLLKKFQSEMVSEVYFKSNRYAIEKLSCFYAQF